MQARVSIGGRGEEEEQLLQGGSHGGGQLQGEVYCVRREGEAGERGVGAQDERADEHRERQDEGVVPGVHAGGQARGGRDGREHGGPGLGEESGDLRFGEHGEGERAGSGARDQEADHAQEHPGSVPRPHAPRDPREELREDVFRGGLGKGLG